MQLERLCQQKIPMTPSGIESATFWQAVTLQLALRRYSLQILARTLTILIEILHCLLQEFQSNPGIEPLFKPKALPPITFLIHVHCYPIMQ